MQYFTFHMQADRLKGHVRMWQMIVTVDSIGIVVTGVFVKRPYNWYIFLFAVLWCMMLCWVASWPLRRQHSLTETTLKLVDRSGFALVIPREEIAGAERFTDRLPHAAAPLKIAYLPQEDTVYMLPDKKNLILLTLKSPMGATLPPKRMAEFTRVIFMVDEPDTFLVALEKGALAPETGMDPTAASERRGTQMAAPSADLADGPAALELRHLTKRFGGYAAVHHLTVRVLPGEIFAFLGSNGAGKSTTIKMLVGLLRPTSGEILIHGQDPWKALSARRQVGYVPDTPLLYENLTGQEHLWLVGGLYDLPEAKARMRARELLELVGLARHADQQIRSFSLGMKRKLAIAAALLHEPPVLLLDEATNGLDPRAAREIKDLIRAQAQAGTTIFLTTHLLDVVDELAHRIAIIDYGALQALGTLAELRGVVGRPEATLEEIFLLSTERRVKEVSA